MDSKNIFLTFDEKNEVDYRDFKYNEDIKQIRISLSIYLLLFLIFSYFDSKLFNDPTNIILIIKFFIVIPIFTITLFSTFTKFFHKYNQYILTVSLIIVGCGLTLMLIISGANFGYYGAIFMVIYSSYFVFSMRYIYSTIVGWVILFFYLIISAINNNTVTIENMIIFIFLMGSNIIGMFGGYFLEYYSRKYFSQQIKIENANHTLEERVMSQVTEISDSQSATIYALAKLAESRDREIGVHIERVGKYCSIIADKIDWSVYSKLNIQKDKFVKTIELASALHDIGKVGIEDRILLKPDILTKEEFSRIKMHTIIGSDTLLTLKKKYPNNDFVNMGLEITRYHHERYDGSGYPDGLAANEIPLSARILAIADVYDALTTKRPYKDIFPHEEAVDIMIKSTGNHFDPSLMKIFKEVEYEFNLISKTNNIIELRSANKTNSMVKFKKI